MAARPATGTPETFEPWDAAEDARIALQDMMAGGDGWGCELAIYAIDRLRRFLEMPEWCARCSTEGHKTYDHWAYACVACGARGATRPRGGGPFTLLATPEKTGDCEHSQMALREVDPSEGKTP